MSPHGRPIRVAVCDDVSDFRLMMRLVLEEDPEITVVGEARDGAEAVDVAAETAADVVLLDLAMPRMDGLEAIPLIRSRAPSSRIVVLSGFGEGPASRSALQLGAHHYLYKGCEFDDIRRAVHEVMERAA